MLISAAWDPARAGHVSRPSSPFGWISINAQMPFVFQFELGAPR
jgi:hypothetical protein